METYLIYIGKVALAAGAFYLAFLLLFQNQKHFSFNRIYLPVSLALSFVIPLITFTTVKYIESANFDVNSFAYLAPASGEIVQPVFVFEWYHYLFGLYILGVGGFLFHLLLGHLKAINIIQKSSIQEIFDNLVNITKKDVHPFSFFSKIVVSEKTLSHPDLEMIVSHENIHVREKHTLDILFTEIIFLFQWFNPFAWLIKDAVKNNLEYKTDNEIAKKYNPQTYQLAMVTLADKQGIAPFLTALNGSQLKNRIVMMKKKTENKYAFVKQLVVLPLLAILVMGLANREVKTEVLQINSTNAIENAVQTRDLNSLLQSDTIVKTDEVKVIGYGTSEKQKPQDSGFRISGGMNGVMIQGSENTVITPKTEKGLKIVATGDKAKQPLFVVDGKETENIENILPENIEKIEVLKDESSTIVYGEKGKNGVVLITTKTAGNITKPEDVKATGFGTQLRSTPTFKSANNNGVGFDFGSFKEVDPTGPPLYIVDGIEKKNIENITPDNIESISVLKDKSAIALYGEKGKNGVILIQTKNIVTTVKIDSSKNPVFFIVEEMPEFPGGEPALKIFLAENTNYPEIARANGIQGKVYVKFIIDKTGKVSNPEIAKGVYPVLDKEALRVVTLLPKWKPGMQRRKPVDVSYTVPVTFGTPDKMQISGTSNPLIIVNGKETGQTINNIDPETIQSVNVLKDETATKKYGEKGKNGVIEVELKSKTLAAKLKLRELFAKELVYPKEALASKSEDLTVYSILIDYDGNISAAYTMELILPEIVVEGIPIEDVENRSNKNWTSEEKRNIFRKEFNRVTEKISKVDIEELKGKSIGVKIRYKIVD